MEGVSVVRCVTLCVAYIGFSACLIHFNKYLMHQDRFPFALPLTTFHMLMTFVLVNCFYLLKPSMFPAMEKTEGQRYQLLRWFVPLGCLFALGLFCSNKAYYFCTVAFLQFMKEANVAVVFTLACFFGLQQSTRSRLFVLCWILFGAFAAVKGEVHFSRIGFFIQALSQMGECGRTVFADWIMRGSSLKLDPLTFTMFLSPVCLCILLLTTILTWHHEIATRAWELWPMLLPNACLAFLLNVLIAVIIKDMNAVTFMLCGLIKDIVIVMASVWFLGEFVNYQQLMGFGICLGGIAAWSHLARNPDSVFAHGLKSALGELQQAENGEMKKLLERKAQQANTV